MKNRANEALVALQISKSQNHYSLSRISVWKIYSISRSLQFAMGDLLAVAPVHPDFSFCDAFYSSGAFGHINAADCIAAERQMPRGAAPVTWSSSRLDEAIVHPFEIPKVYLEGKKSGIAQGS